MSFIVGLLLTLAATFTVRGDGQFIVVTQDGRLLYAVLNRGD